MFTGIVQTMGQVAAIERNSFGVRLTIDPRKPLGWNPPAYALIPGSSISVSGVCLTLVKATEQGLLFDVIAETLAKTTLGRLTPGGLVNLEPAVTADSAMSGHFVQGHVDGVGKVTKVIASKEEWRVTVQPPADLMPYAIPKGSVSIDGVSLTIAALHPESLEVALIPTTLQITTLGTSAEGQEVNLEMDILSKTIVHHLRSMLGPTVMGGENATPGAPGAVVPGVTRQLLQQAGFSQ